MKIASLFCPCNGRADNPPDHYSSGACKNLPGPLGWILSILREQESDEIHRDMTITTTRVVSSCAREVAILDNIPVEGFDWKRANSIHWGNIVHADLRANLPPGQYGEVMVPPEGAEPPLVLGLPLRGRLDHVVADLSEVVDYKAHSELKQKKVASKSVEPEIRAQLSVYGLMVSRAYNVPMPRLRVCNVAMVSAGSQPIYWQDVQPMTENDILAMKPFGGLYSVADRIAEYRQFEQDRIAGVSVKDAISKMSLMGRTMWRGDKCLKYCFAKDICDKLVGIAGI